MGSKPRLIAAGVAAAFVLMQSPRAALAFGIPVLVVAYITRSAFVAIRRPAVRRPMIVAGIVVGAAVVAFFVAGNDLMFVMAGVPGLFVAASVYAFGMGTGLDRHAPIVVMAGVALAYWLVNTAILGMIITFVGRLRGARGRA